MTRHLAADEHASPRDALRRSAEQLFAAHGVDGVSLRQITREAGQRNTTALQYHFGSRDGLLHPGKQGAAWLAVESGCPVIPVGLKGTQHMFSCLLPHRGAITVRIGAPIQLEDIDPTASKGVRRRLLNARIMDEIQKLSGQRRA